MKPGYRGRMVQPYTQAQVRHGSRRSRWIGVLLLVVAAIAAVRAYQVHAYGWEWGLIPSAAPPKVVFDHRNYSRGQVQTSVPEGWSHQDDTMGGGEIFAPVSNGHAPTVIDVRDGSTVWGYALMGGP